MADDVLDASMLNQEVNSLTLWAGKVQKMTFSLGVPKGMKKVLEERGINTDTLDGDQTLQILSNQDDFKNEKPRVIYKLS